MRAFWPYVSKASRSIARVRKEMPFEVASCWNGAVVFKADLHHYRPPIKALSGSTDSSYVTHDIDGKGRHFQQKVKQPSEVKHDHKKLVKRGWKMIDNCQSRSQPLRNQLTASSLATFPNSRSSPDFELPYGFRASGIDACDHSECFLFSYDLHRYYRSLDEASGAAGPPKRPKIYMNPAVKVAYEKRWWVWHNVVLRMPIVKWWLGEDCPDIPLGNRLTDRTNRSLVKRRTFRAGRLDLGSSKSQSRPLHMGWLHHATSLSTSARS